MLDSPNYHVTTSVMCRSFPKSVGHSLKMERLFRLLASSLTQSSTEVSSWVAVGLSPIRKKSQVGSDSG